MNKVRAIYLQAGKNIYPEIVEIMPDGSNLEELYRLLNCRTIDIVKRPFGNKYFNVIVDDEGLLKDNFIPSAFSVAKTKGTQLDLVGNLLVVGPADDEGNFTEISDQEIFTIFMQVNFYKHNGESCYALMFREQVDD